MRPHHHTGPQAGFSMIEVLIATSVMLIVLASVFALMATSLGTSNTTYELTEAQESLRTAQEYINRDLTTVGDGLKSIGSIQIPIGFVRNYLTLAPGINPGNFPIIASDDNVPGTTVVVASVPAANVLGGTDRMTLLTIDSTFTPIPLAAGKINLQGNNINVSATDLARFNVGEIYCVTSQYGAAFGTVTALAGGANPTIVMSPGDVYGLNQNNGPITAASRDTLGNAVATSLARIRIIEYFVNSNRLLIRRVFGVRGQGFLDNVVAEHVTDMTIRYTLNLPDANGFAQQPVTQLATVQQQVAVREVEVSITTETAHLVNKGATWPLTMVTSTSVRNLQFRRALEPTNGG